MMLQRAALNTLLKRIPFNFSPSANYANQAGGWFNERQEIGKREWVGYGSNGFPTYSDIVEYPMPAVRFKEITGDLVALKEKEKGDWKKLSLEEKKTLYRASFRQTFAEIQAPTGEWKSIMGWTLFFVSSGLMMYISLKKFVLPPMPESFSEENRSKQFRKFLVNKYGHLDGLSSKWDYEKDDWK